MPALFALWGSRALSWALGPGLKLLLIGLAATTALTWFSHQISSGAMAKMEVGQLREALRVHRQESARLRAIEDDLDQLRDRHEQQRAAAQQNEQQLKQELELLSERARQSPDCQLSIKFRRALNQ